MWGTVLLLALPAAIDPMRLGIVVLLISLSRPMLNLLAFWLGSMTSFIAIALGVLLLLRDLGLTVAHSLSSTSASSTARHLQIASGLLALLIAVGLWARQRARTRSGDGSARQPSTPTAFSRLSARAKVRLENGSLWLAFVAGFGMPAAAWLALAAITASGAAIGAQLSAAAVYAVLQLAVVQVPLVSYLVKPAKTQAVILRLHDWVRAHGRQILAGILAVAGVLLVVNAA